MSNIPFHEKPWRHKLAAVTIAWALVFSMLYVCLSLMAATWHPFEWHWTLRSIGAIGIAYAFHKTIYTV